eukprot:782474-Amphidinium_carterae.1
MAVERTVLHLRTWIKETVRNDALKRTISSSYVIAATNTSRCESIAELLSGLESVLVWFSQYINIS